MKLQTYPKPSTLAPRFPHSADVRRHIGPLTGQESLILELLERQRHTQRRVRAYIADPQQKYSTLLEKYIQWIQIYILPSSTCLLHAPSTRETLLYHNDIIRRTIPHQSCIPNYALIKPRSPYSAHSLPAVNQALILNADRICPSIPYNRSKIDIINTHIFGTLPIRGSIHILAGDPYRRRRNRYRQLWNTLHESTLSNPDIPWQLLEPADPASQLAPQTLHPPAASINYAPDPALAAGDDEESDDDEDDYYTVPDLPALPA